MLENENDDLVEVRNILLRLLIVSILRKTHYTYVSRKGNMVKLSKKKAGGLCGHPCESVGGAGKKWSLFGTVLH